MISARFWTAFFCFTLGASICSAQADAAPPSVPAGLAATSLTATSFTLTWSASTDNVRVTGYEVFKNGVSTGITATTSSALAGLAPGTAYSLCVRARDAAGNWSAQSSPLSVTTAADTTPPVAPTGLAASAITATGFALSWSPTTDNVAVTGYEVFNAGVSVGTVTTTKKVFSGLAPTTGYALTVRARDAAGNWSAQSASFTVTTTADTTPPSVPAGLAASSVTMNGFTLTWSETTDNIGVTGYEAFKNGVSIGTAATTSFALTGLAPSTAYSLRVRARDAAGNWSTQSAALSVTTARDSVAPSVPTGLAASGLAATGFTLTWTAATDNVAVTGYEVFKAGVSLGTVTTTSKSITGLAPTTTYALTVRARDAAGNWSAQSAVLSVTTAADTTAPAVPAGLATTAVTATGLTLRWTATTDDVRVTGYEVFQGGVSIGTAATNAKVIKSLAPVTAYAFTVRARDAAGNWSAPSAAFTATTAADTTPPAVPAGLTASSITISSFLLRWSAPTDDVATTGYEVFQDGVSVGTTTAPSVNFSGLALSTSYVMRVRARDAAGNWSGLSAPRTVTTLADTTPPTVPAGLAASAIALKSFTLSWNASTDNVGTTTYEVFKGSVSLGTTQTTTLDVSGLTANTSYALRVRARDAAGNWSAQSAALTVRTLPDTTPPAAPTGLAASAVTVTSLALTWNAATDDIAVTAYEVFRNAMSLGTTTALTKSITGLAPATAYTFTVRARDAAGNWSDQSAVLSASTLPDTTAPSAPTSLVASAINVTSFTLAWTAATDDVRVTGYEVFRDGVSIGLAGGVTKVVTGLVPATSYSITVRARDAAGNWSAPSAALSVATPPDTTPPAAPTGLTASAITISGFTLRWGVPLDNVHVTLYEVFKEGVSLGTTSAPAKGVTGLSPDTTYALTVRASDAAGNWSGLSAAFPVTTLADTTSPTVPTGLAVSAITASGGSLAWTAATDAVGVTRYEIFQDGVSVGVTSATTFALSGLTPATTYSLTVRAGDAAGNWSAQSAAKSFKTIADTAAPVVPVGLAASAIASTSFTLTWTPSTDNVGVSAYEVFRGGVSLGTTGSTSMDIGGLALSTAYAMKVRARDTAGNWSAQSAALTVTTLGDVTAPSVPAGLTATGLTTTGFTLLWNAATDDAAVSAYEVFRNGTSLGTTAISSFTLSGLTLNSTSSLTVRARDAAGNWSALSAPLSVTTASDTIAPSAPDGLVSSNVSPTGFTLGWNPSSDDLAVSGYEVFVNGASVGATMATTFDVTGLASGSTFVATVRARDAAGNWSAQSAPLTVGINRVPYTTGFEPADGYQPGSLQSQNGWGVIGSASIVTTPVNSGQQAVEIAPAASLSLVTRPFANIDPRVTFVDFYVRPAAAATPDAGVFLDTDVASLALTGTGPTGTISAYDGDGALGGAWHTMPASIALDLAGRATAWLRLTARIDYNAKHWDLYVNGKLVAADLGFFDNTLASFTTFNLSGHATLATGFDDFLVAFDHPLFADVNNNGIDDAWETAHALSLATNNRNDDPDGDGFTNIWEYIAGTDPRDYYNGVAPTVTSSVATGTTLDGQGLVTFTLTGAGGRILANAPVAIATGTAGAGLAASAGGTAAAQLTLTTDANGQAAVYVAFNANTSADLTLTAGNGANAASIALTVLSSTSSGGVIVIPDAWQTANFGHTGVEPAADPDGDGLTNLQEYQQGTDPNDFFNGISPVVDSENGGNPDLSDALVMKVRKPDGTPWSNAPVTFRVTTGDRRISATPGGPSYSNLVEARTDSNGIAKAYLESL